MDNSEDLTQKLARLLRQSRVLRQQSDLIAEAAAGIQAEIEALRAEASAKGLALGEDAE